MRLRTRKQRLDYYHKQYDLIQVDLDKAELRAAKELHKLYRATFRDVKSDIAAAYEKYSTDGRLSKAELMQYNRLVEMQRVIGNKLKQLGDANVDMNAKYIHGAARFSYMRSRYASQSVLGLSINSYGINERVLEAALTNPLDKIGHASRTILNLGDSALQVTNAINEAILKGYEYGKTAAIISRFELQGFNRAMRIVRTEQHRASQVALNYSLQEAKEAGEELGLVIRKRWLSAKDSSVRDSHDYLDGQLSDEAGLFYSDTGAITKYPGGFGLPEEDINCRCTMSQEIISDKDGILNEAITVPSFERWNKANGEKILYVG